MSEPSASRPQQVPATRRHGKTRGRNGGGRRAPFRAWRRTRPFWAGLLLLLGGLELLAIPLSGVLLKGAIKLVIYIGIGGVFGVLIGVLMVTAGIVLWFNPAHRVFYSIAGVVLGLISFPASNLGGFFIGMLLAMIGGALGFAWTPGKPASAFAASAADPQPADAAGPRATFTPRSAGYHPPAETIADGMPAIPDDAAPDDPAPHGAASHGAVSHDATPGSAPEAAPEAADGGLPGLGLAEDRRHRLGESGGGTAHRMLAVAAMPAVLVAGLVGARSAVAQAETPQSASGCVFGIFCSAPSPSPSPTPSSGSGGGSGSQPTPAPSSSSSSSGLLPLPSASQSAGSSPLQGVLPSPSTAAGKNAAKNAAKSKNAKNAKNAKAKQVTAPHGLTAPSATSQLTTGSAVMKNFNFVGVTSLPKGGGGSEQVMEFTADTASLTKSVHVTVTQDGSVTNSYADSFVFTDGMTLYTTKLCGEVEGITPNVCFTPTTVSEVLLKLASVLGKATPITMLNATISQPLVESGQLTVTPTKMSATWTT